MAANLKAGRHFGKYRILEELGEGPMTHVFLADDTVLYRKVALKILKPEFARDLPSGEGAEEEMCSAAALLHSGIVPLYGTGSDHGFYYYSMALMPGGNLRSALGQGISPHQALTILSQISRPLAFAHGRGINHQGIKPENILFRKDGSAVLADFHSAKVHGFGTGVLAREPDPHPQYVSPEQLQSSGRQFGLSDQYSLGIVLFEMLTGEVPYRGENAAAQHINAAIPKLPPTLSEYQPLLDRLLAKKPSDRFADVNQLIEVLDKHIARKRSENKGKVTVLPLGRIKPLSATPHPAPSAPLPLSTEDVPAAEGPPVAMESPADLQPEDLLEGSTASKSSGRGKGHPRRKYLSAALLVLLSAAAGGHWMLNRTFPPVGGEVALSEQSEIVKPPSAPPLPEVTTAAEEPPAWSVAEAEIRGQFSRALAYAREGRTGDAAALYLEMIDQTPLPEIYNNLAAILASEGKLDESQERLQEALRVHPSYATVYENLNTIQLEKALGPDYQGAFLASGEEALPPQLQVITEISAVPMRGAHPFASPVRETPLAAPQPPVAIPEGPQSADPATTYDDYEAAAEVLTRWAGAWSAQDFPGYLAFYSRDFQPDQGVARETWEQNRHRNVTTPQWIEVSLGELSFSVPGPERLRLVAVQDYRSDSYRDRTLKAFELGREGDGWVILSEESLAILR